MLSYDYVDIDEEMLVQQEQKSKSKKSYRKNTTAKRECVLWELYYNGNLVGHRLFFILNCSWGSMIDGTYDIELGSLDVEMLCKNFEIVFGYPMSSDVEDLIATDDGLLKTQCEIDGTLRNIFTVSEENSKSVETFLHRFNTYLQQDFVRKAKVTNAKLKNRGSSNYRSLFPQN